MPRIPPIDPAAATPEVRETLERLPDLKVFGLVAHAPTVLRPWLRMGRALLAETELDPALRELAILRVAALHPGGAYEQVHHEQLAREVGVTEAQLKGARTGEGLEGPAAMVVRFAGEVVRDGQPSAEAFDAAHALLGDRRLMELLLVIGHYQGLANVFAAAQIELDPAAGAEVADSARRASSRWGGGA